MLQLETETYAQGLLQPTTHVGFRNKDEQKSTGEKERNVNTKVGLRISCIVAIQILFLTAGGLSVQPDSSAPLKHRSPPSLTLPGTMCTAHPAAGSSSSAESAPTQEALTAHLRAYHDHPPTGPLPTTLDPADFTDNPKAFVAYSIATRIRELLYQEPCYCHCDQNEGHESLFDCYTRKHAVRCFACQSEAIFIFEQNKMGKTAADIRAALARGEWTNVDVGKYAEAHYRDYCNVPSKPGESARAAVKPAKFNP